jgi:hypothetical protein
MDLQPLSAAIFIAIEPQTALTLRKNATSMKLLINENIAAQIPHAFPFPVVLRREVP